MAYKPRNGRPCLAQCPLCGDQDRMEYLPRNSQQMVAKSGAIASAQDSAASDCVGNVKSKVLQEGDWFEFLHLINYTSLLTNDLIFKRVGN